MEKLIIKFYRILDKIDTNFVRFLHDKIDWNSRLIAILGSRGVGKTTLILQHIKLFENKENTLFVDADDFYFSNHRLEELAEKFYLYGGKTLYIDEIHKYPNWSIEIKNIYDLLPDLKIVYTGSSILDLEKGGADLSRRKLQYFLPGLSFREFLNIELKLNLKVFSLDDILNKKLKIDSNLKILPLFKKYLEVGYYPFYKEGNYLIRLNQVVMQIVENDIPNFATMNISSARKLKKLLYILAQSVPFKPNYSKLEQQLEISRNTLPNYLDYLEKAGLISILRQKANGTKILDKIEKIYLDNPNIAYCISNQTPNIGNIRETIFFAWLKINYFICSSKISDFEVNEFTFEIGGKNKTQKQIQNASKGFVVKDDIEIAVNNIIPLWQFGFLY